MRANHFVPRDSNLKRTSKGADFGFNSQKVPTLAMFDFFFNTKHSREKSLLIRDGERSHNTSNTSGSITWAPNILDCIDVCVYV